MNPKSPAPLQTTVEEPLLDGSLLDLSSLIIRRKRYNAEKAENAEKKAVLVTEIQLTSPLVRTKLLFFTPDKGSF